MSRRLHYESTGCFFQAFLTRFSPNRSRVGDSGRFHWGGGGGARVRVDDFKIRHRRAVLRMHIAWPEMQDNWMGCAQC